MRIRKSNHEDVNAIMRLIHQAQAYFKASGIDQWQDGYPTDQNIHDDISLHQSYVLDNNDVVGTMFFTFDGDPCYQDIDGCWKTQNQPYGVIHRIVVDENQKGNELAKQLLDFAIKECQNNHIKSIRIDTHLDNLSMQRFLTKNGFIKCGMITLESGALRVAFEKIIE